MLALRQDSEADTGSRRGFILRWLAVALVLIAIGLAGLSTANAHPFQADTAGSIVDIQDASGPDNAHCCHEGQNQHDGDSCPAYGQCGGCALDGDKIGAPKPSSAAHRSRRLATLPVGLVTSPAGHPPKSI